MYSNRIFGIAILFMPLLSWSQSEKSNNKSLNFKMEILESKMDSLQSGYQLLEKDKEDLKIKLRSIYREELKEMEKMIRDAFDKTDVITISATYQEVIKSIMSLHNEIARINNFTDAEKVFGFDFAASIIEIAEKSFIQKLETDGENPEKTRSRKEYLRTIIKEVIDNPIISGILKSNPISSVAHSIINQFISYNKVERDPYIMHQGQIHIPENYKKFKEEYIDFSSSFRNKGMTWNTEIYHKKLSEPIDNFTQAIKPMISIFDQLSIINEKYSSSLDVYMNNNEQTIERAKPLELEFYRLLKAGNRQEASEKISHFFNIGENPNIEILEEKVSEKQMKKVLEFSIEVREGLEVLKHDFLNLITLEIELTDEYLLFFKQLLDTTENMHEMLNQEVLQAKINQFEQLNRSLHEQKKRLEN